VRTSPLGTTDLNVSALCLGTATLGVAPLATDADALVGRALELGVTFFDTANSYGNQPRFDRAGAPPAALRSSAEEILGLSLRGRRDRVVLATKVGEYVGPYPDDRGLRAPQVARQIDNSLRRLRTDYIDLYQAHHPDPNVPIEETLGAFDQAVRAGKVLTVGLSTYQAWEVVEALWTAERRGYTSPVCHQVLYNLVDLRAESDVLPVAERFGLSTTAFSPLAGGLLAGPGTRARDVWGSRRFGTSGPVRPDALAKAEALDALSEEVGAPTSALALRWLATRSTVTSVIVGAESVSELEAAAWALDGAQDELLDQGVLDRVDAIGRGRVPVSGNTA
jgi:aryl-alcohol dehydrogenase-like predicted oxidoreductase